MLPIILRPVWKLFTGLGRSLSHEGGGFLCLEEEEEGGHSHTAGQDDAYEALGSSLEQITRAEGDAEGREHRQELREPAR